MLRGIKNKGELKKDTWGLCPFCKHRTKFILQTDINIADIFTIDSMDVNCSHEIDVPYCCQICGNNLYITLSPSRINIPELSLSSFMLPSKYDIERLMKQSTEQEKVIDTLKKNKVIQ